MTKILNHVKPYILQIIIVIIFVYIQVQTSLALPNYMANIVNQGIVLGDNNYILQTGGSMLLVSLLGAVATIIAGFLSSKIATGYARDLREDVFARVESFSLKEFDKFSTSSLITRSTNDIQQIQMVFFMILRMVVSAPIMGVGAIIMAYQTAPSMSWLIGLAVLVILALIVVIFIFAMPKFQKLQKLVDKLNLVTRENLSGLRIIRAFTNEKYEEEKFAKVNNDLTKVNLFVTRIGVVMQPIMMLVLNLVSIAIIWFGAQLVNNNQLNIGQIMAFMQYAMQVIMSFLMFSMVFILIPRAWVSALRVNAVLKSEPEIVDPKKPVAFEASEKGKLEFKDVTFSYPNSDTPVLNNISFKAVSGKTTAFIGSTGSGKSTLINLIMRFYDVSEGSILVAGQDIRKVKQADLHERIGYVPQKGVLFSGTVKSNLKLGAEQAGEAELESAADIAQATDFINKLENKFDAPISQGGKNVSGGQKQRLAIARAIMKRPEIYIFDDSFSALDFKTDSKLRQALAKATVGATVLTVSQRISTVMHADNIVVLDEGRIVGQGTHSDLLKTCAVYKEIAESQLSSEELQEIDADMVKERSAK